MGKIATVVGDMPFAGRAAVENAYFWARSETKDINTKCKRCAVAASFLLVFAGLHAVQAKMGMADLSYDVAEVRKDPNLKAYFETSVSGLYSLAMGAVTYTQLQLAGKTVVDTLDVIGDISRDEATEARRPFQIDTPKMHEVAFTLVGQLLFASLNDGRL